MPDLNTLPVPQYEAGQAYHWEYDNLPLKTLEDRDTVINGELSVVSKIVSESSGSQGTLSQRLAQSLDDDGSLISVAIDEALHSIAEHTNDSKTVDEDELNSYISLGFPELENPVAFVRMLQVERDKLNLIANEATNMTISVETPSNIILFEQGPINFVNSSSIVFEVFAENKIKAELAISTDFAHRHYYDIEPIIVTDKLYKVTSAATPYIEDSLKVYINGTRLSSSASVYYPDSTVSSWNANKFTPDHEEGTFILENEITEDDIIRIDFDISLT